MVAMGGVLSMSGGLNDHQWRKLCEWAKAVMPPVCHICGMDIDMSLSGRNPWGWSLDHVRSRRDFPELAYDPGNVRPAHMRCNSRKQAGDVPRRPKSSRRWGRT